MFIVSQDRRIIVNADNITNIYISGDRILAHMIDSEEILLGSYENGRKTKEVIEEMLNAILAPNAFAERFKKTKKEPWGVTSEKDSDIKQIIPREIYYMPEE